MRAQAATISAVAEEAHASGYDNTALGAHAIACKELIGLWS